MPFSLRIRAFLFGIFATVLSAAWVRGLGLALGGDAYGTDLATIVLMISACVGAGIGTFWVQTEWKRWWPAFVVFGIGGTLLILIVPSFGQEFQSIYHYFEGGWKSALVLFSLVFLLAAAPFFAAGVAFARMTAGADGEVMTPLAFGAATGLVLLDFLLGPILGGLPVLLLSGAGILALSVGMDNATPLVDQEPQEAKRALIFALILGVVFGMATKALSLYLFQFFPGTRGDLTWIHIFMVAAFSFGAVGFGNPATVSDTPLLWSGVFASLAGSFLAISIMIINYLAVPDQYDYYFSFFGAQDGSFMQALLLVAGVGGLPALATGACVRCLSDPVSSSGRPTPAGLAATVGIGSAFGFMLASFYFIPVHGLLVTVSIPVYILILAGIAALILISKGTAQIKGAAAGFCVLMALFTIPPLPGEIKVRSSLSRRNAAVPYEVEGSDGIAQAVREREGGYQIRWNHNPVTIPQDNLEKLEIGLSVLLSGGPDEALCLSPLTPLRYKLLGEAGISRVDLSPNSYLLGELSMLVNQGNPLPILRNFRATAGIDGKYSLILAMPEPLWPQAVSSRWTEEAFEAIKSKLTDNGCFVLWFHGRDNSSESLRQISRSFTLVFPNTTTLMAFDGLDGPNFALVGRLDAYIPDSGSSGFTSTLARLKRTEAFADLPLRAAEDLKGLEIAHHERILQTTKGSSRNLGPFPALAWSLKPRFDPKEQVQGIEFFRSLATTGFSTGENGQVEISRTEIPRILLAGFIEHTQSRKTYGIYRSPLEEADLTEGELDRFMEAFQAWPTFTPNIRLWKALGDKLLERKQYEQGIHYLSQAVALAPAETHFLSLLGQCYYHHGKYDEAEKALDRVSQSQQEDWKIWFILGLARSKQENHGDAADSLERARHLNPKNVQVLIALALTYQDLKDRDRAMEILESARELDPSNASIQEAMAALKE